MTRCQRWLAQAALPWSPVSTKGIWNRARAKGLSIEEALQHLERTEARTLARDSQATLRQLQHPN